MPARISEEIRIQQINDLASIRFIRWFDVYANNRSYAVCECLTCGNEWIARVGNLLSGKSCPKCSHFNRHAGRRVPKDERVSQINSIDGVTFVSWHGDEYRNNNAKIVVRCHLGHEWIVSVNNLVNHGRGCPKCSDLRKTKIRQVPSIERIKQINDRDNISFISWKGDYHGSYSFANVKCEIDGYEWCATVNNLVNHKRGCPRCSRTGYDNSRVGNMYALRSECGGHVKIGITNRDNDRFSELKRNTPFNFSIIEKVSGDGLHIQEIERYFHGKYERSGFSGFDGATEWLVCTPELLEEIRSIANGNS